MEMPTVKRCFCCSLRTGGLLIGSYGILACIALLGVSFSYKDSNLWIAEFYVALSWCAWMISLIWIFGITSNRTDFMMFPIILTLLGTIVSLAAPIWIPFVTNKFAPNTDSSIRIYISLGSGVFHAVCLFFMYSLYVATKKESQLQANRQVV